MSLQDSVPAALSAKLINHSVGNRRDRAVFLAVFPRLNRCMQFAKYNIIATECSIVVAISTLHCILLSVLCNT